MTGVIAGFESTGIDDNATSTAITIDASENVGIGTSSPTGKLTVNSSASNEGVIRLGDNATYYGELSRINATDEVRLSSNGGSQNLTFHTANNERLRINAAGNVGIGLTSGTGKLAVQGYVASGGQNYTLQLSDAVNSTFRIGHQSGLVNLISDQDIGLYTSSVERVRVTDNGLTFNGDTAAANALDDYEEGTWTPAYTVGSSGYSNQVGKYTKIGEQVTAYFYLQMNNNQVGGSTLHVGGLPFTCNSNSSYGAASGIHCNSWSTSAKKPDNGLVAPNNTVIDLYHSQGTTATTQPVGNDIGNGSLIGCVVYRTSS